MASACNEINKSQHNYIGLKTSFIRKIKMCIGAFITFLNEYSTLKTTSTVKRVTPKIPAKTSYEILTR